MPRYKLTVEYDGTKFVGWQWQANGLSIQQALENAIELIAGEFIRVYGAGRTDSGVHALGQICHIDTRKEFTGHQLKEAINSKLSPHKIAVLAAEIVTSDFDARRSAIKRTYEYRIINRRAPLTVDKNRAWRISRALNVTAMQHGASRLLGQHDFTSFRASSCQAHSPVRYMESFTVVRRGENIYFTAKSRSFLHHQMRAMVGTLVLIGDGSRKETYITDVLQARDRGCAGPNAPPWGLYLTTVNY